MGALTVCKVWDFDLHAVRELGRSRRVFPKIQSTGRQFGGVVNQAAELGDRVPDGGKPDTA